MAYEAFEIIHATLPLSDAQYCAGRYFAEILSGHEESKDLHPYADQVDFVFRESNDRWVQFCARFNRVQSVWVLTSDAFDQWSKTGDHGVLLVLK